MSNQDNYTLRQALNAAIKDLNLLPLSLCILLNTHSENYLNQNKTDSDRVFKDLQLIWKNYKKWENNPKLQKKSSQYCLDLQMLLGVLVSCGAWFDDSQFHTFQHWLLQVTQEQQPENSLQETAQELAKYKSAANQITKGLKALELLQQQDNSTQNTNNNNSVNNNNNYNDNNTTNNDEIRNKKKKKKNQKHPKERNINQE